MLNRHHPHLAKGIIAALLMSSVVSNSAESADTRVISGLNNPDSVEVGTAGTIYITEKGEVGKRGDGRISFVDTKHRLRTYVDKLDDPSGIVRWKRKLFIVDRNRILRIDGNAPRPVVFVNALQFPELPTSLGQMTLDSRGNLYVADMGDIKKSGKGAIYRVSEKGKVFLITNEQKTPELKNPGAIVYERPGKLLVADFITGDLFRLDTATAKTEKISSGYVSAYGLARGSFGSLYISTSSNGHIWKLNLKKPETPATQYTAPFQQPAGIHLSKTRKFILVPDTQAGTLTYLPKQ